MRTLVLSDLHLSSGTDVLAHAHVRERLVAELAEVDRLVLLGDTIELRHGPVQIALDQAAEALTAIGAALRPGAEVLLVAGNHDHDLVRPWLDSRRPELGFERLVAPSTASPVARRVAALLGGHITIRAGYPGVWLRDDIYAFHGHYLDVHGQTPTFERLAAGMMARLVGLPGGDGEATVAEYERVLAPLYAWIHATAQRTLEGEKGAGAGRASRVWTALHGDGHQPVRARVVLAALPFGVRGLTALGLGQLSGDLSMPALLESSLKATGEVVARLGIKAEHVIFGHSHRAGPLATDDPIQWRTRSGAWLHNSGCWVHEPSFTGAASTANPYWPGTAIVVGERGAPRLVRLLEGVRLP